MKKLLILLFVALSCFLFADLEITIPDGSDLVGSAYHGTNYQFDSEEFDVLNNLGSGDYTVELIVDDNPQGMMVTWCHGGLPNIPDGCHSLIFGAWPFAFEQGETLHLHTTIQVIAAGTVNFHYVITSDLLDNDLVIPFTFVTEGFTSNDNLVAPVVSLNQNYPNPFNPETTLSYSIPENTQGSITIYNILGQVVKNFENLTSDNGSGKVKWYGDDNAGNNVASGVYYYKLTVGNNTDIKKMMLMK